MAEKRSLTHSKNGHLHEPCTHRSRKVELITVLNIIKVFNFHSGVEIGQGLVSLGNLTVAVLELRVTSSAVS